MSNEDKWKVMPMDIKKCKLFEDKAFIVISSQMIQTYQYMKDVQCFEKSM